MNLEQLSEDIVAAINQFYTYDEVLPYSAYRVRLVNKLIEHNKYLQRAIYRQKQKAEDAKIQPDLPWD